MLDRESNELLCRVGPGTAMGAVMREYWLPALRSTELPGPDCAPVRVMLLGEKLIAFRDSSGRVGLVADACPHRGASLFFGRNESNGLRCAYHGWKFDVSGTCVDMPNEPPESNFKNKVCAKAYACTERAGLVWTYMGPREEPPAMPDFEVFDYPDEMIRTTAFMYRCNWVQAMEGNNDLTHVSFLHAGHSDWKDMPPGIMRAATYDRQPVQKILDIEAGVMAGGCYRNPDDEANTQVWAIGQWLFPFYSLVPTGELGKKVQFVANVPMDDEHQMNFVANVDFSLARVFPEQEYTGELLLPNTTDWYGRFRWRQCAENDYLLDRDRQRNGESYSGIEGNIIEDVAITESMGPIIDRSKERLGAADVQIIRIRRRLLAAAEALANDGVAPPGVDHPTAYRVRSGTTVLPKDADWIEATKPLRAVPDEPMIPAR